jgi:hypothetical protein
MIENTKREILDGFVHQTVSPNVSLTTDEHPAYGKLNKLYAHQIVRHCEGEYVRGEVHTNSVENFWSLLKRSVMGTYHNVSKKYLPLCLNEFTFRFNNRKTADIFGVSTKRLLRQDHRALPQQMATVAEPRSIEIAVFEREILCLNRNMARKVSISTAILQRLRA